MDTSSEHAGGGGQRDVALVLSGGSINGVLMELGFLQCVRETELWPRVGWIFGTSAGALAGTMAALDRLDDLEAFLLDLQPDDAFRPRKLWRLPLLGALEYTLPATVAREFGNLDDVARALAESERELIVSVTDVTDTTGEAEHDYELVYRSRTTPPELFASAILASAAISTLVLPLRVGDRIATDGAWARNLPLAHAYAQPEVERIVAFRYVARYPRADATGLVRVRERLQRFGRVPPVRALIEELREAEERDRRGEPPHMLDMIRRVMRVAVLRNTLLEERWADEKDGSIRELQALRHDVAALVAERVTDPDERRALLSEIDRRFAGARFPFRHDRLLPRITVRATPGAVRAPAGAG